MRLYKFIKHKNERKKQKLITKENIVNFRKTKYDL